LQTRFLGLSGKYFGEMRNLAARKGFFMFAWALTHTIDVNPGGIKEPIQIAILGRAADGVTPAARLLNEDELKEHQENVRGVEQYLAKYKEMLQGKGGKKIPEIPSSSSSASSSSAEEPPTTAKETASLGK